MILRPGTPEDVSACGVVCFEAFKAIATEHNFPWDFPSTEVATGLMKTLLAHPGFYSVVAEHNGKVVGSNFPTNAARLLASARLPSIPPHKIRRSGGS